MILNLSFSNYRSFKDECVFSMEPSKSEAKGENLCQVDTTDGSTLQVLKVAVIFGANASGKTNIVKFLYRLKRWVLNQDIMAGKSVPLYDPFKFDEDFLDYPCSFSIEFIANGVRYKYYVKFNKREVLTEKLDYWPNGRIITLYDREIGNDASYHQINAHPSLKIKSLQVFPNQLLLSKFVIDTPCEEITKAAIYIATITISNGYHEDMLLGKLKECASWLMEEKSRADKLKEFLIFANTGLNGFQATLKGENVEVDGFHRRFKDQIEVGKSALPFQEESFGTRALFLLGCTILQSLENGSPLFADEIDSGLHVYINQLIVNIFKDKRINNKNAQLIFTTHNVNLLDPNIIRKDQIWFVEKDGYGNSELYALTDFEDVRETTPFAKWYMASKFGAVPTLKSLEGLFVENDGTEE